MYLFPFITITRTAERLEQVAADFKEYCVTNNYPHFVYIYGQTCVITMHIYPMRHAGCERLVFGVSLSTRRGDKSASPTVFFEDACACPPEFNSL